MNTAQLYRIAWKDGRRMGALWLALLGFWILAVVVTTWQASSRTPTVPIVSLEGLVLLIPAITLIHGLAWSGVTFAAEHEDGNYDFLRALPVDAKHVYYGKLYYGIISTAALAIALSLISAVARWFLYRQGINIDETNSGPNSINPGNLASSTVLSTLPIFMTTFAGLFWSLRLKRPLVSLALSAVSLVGILTLMMVLTETAKATDQNRDWILWVLTGCFCAIGFLVTRRMADSWLPNHDTSNVVFASQFVAPTSSRKQSATSRLFWLQYRQGNILVAGLVFLAFSFAAIFWDPPTHYGFFDTANRVLPAFLLIGFLGLYCFRADHQKRNYQILSQLGISPTYYWFSRLALPLVVTMFAIIVTGRFFDDYWFPYVACGMLGVLGISQLASLLFVSTIIATAVTIFTSIAAWSWLLICLVSSVPFWLAAIPIVVLPLLASYWRVPRWLQQRSGWKSWLLPATPIALLLIGWPAATVLYRIYEVPHADLPDAYQQVDLTVTESEGTQAYRTVFNSLPRNFASEQSIELRLRDRNYHTWLAQHPELVPKLTAAVQQGGPIPEEFRFCNSSSYVLTNELDAMQISGVCLVIAAEEAVANQDSTTAWNHFRTALELVEDFNDGKSGSLTVLVASRIESAVYERLVAWAMSPDNSTERIVQAAEYINAFRQRQIPERELLPINYTVMRRLWDDPATLADASRYYIDPSRSNLKQFSFSLPWERTRSLRLLRLVYATRSAEQQTIGEQRLESIERIKKLAATTLLSDGLETNEFSSLAEQHRNYLRRGTIGQLAAIADGLDKATYPADLNTIRLDDKPLLEWIGNEFRISSDDQGSFLDVPTSATFSDGWGAGRRFLLPQLASWDTGRYQQRLVDSSSNPNPPATQASEQVPSDSTNQFNDTGGFADLGIEDSATKLAGFLGRLDPSGTQSLLFRELRERLATPEPRIQHAIVDFIATDRELLLWFLPQLLEFKDSDDLLLAEYIARQLEISLEEALLSETQFAARDISFAEHFSAPTQNESWLGVNSVPIRNPQNGYYYEHIEVLYASITEAKKYAALRTFRGCHGRVVSASADPLFFKLAFPYVQDFWRSDAETDTIDDSKHLLIEYPVPAEKPSAVKPTVDPVSDDQVEVETEAEVEAETEADFPGEPGEIPDEIPASSDLESKSSPEPGPPKLTPTIE